MPDDAITEALDRLQSALDRLESFAEAVGSAAVPVANHGDDTLRAEVQSVIAELDRMIGGQRG